MVVGRILQHSTGMGILYIRRGGFPVVGMFVKIVGVCRREHAHALPRVSKKQENSYHVIVVRTRPHQRLITAVLGGSCTDADQGHRLFIAAFLDASSAAKSEYEKRSVVMLLLLLCGRHTSPGASTRVSVSGVLS